MPSIGDVHIDQALSNVSVAYMNDTYIADKIMPIVPVDKRSDKYFRYKKESFLSGTGIAANGLPNSLRTPKSKSTEIDYGNDTGFYDCHEFSLADIIPDEQIQAEDQPLNGQIDSTEFLTERLKIDNETAAVQIVGNPANYNSNNTVALTTGGTGTSWAQGGTTTSSNPNSNPFNFFNNARIAIRKGIAKAPNQIALGEDVAQILSNHPEIVERVKYTHGDALTACGLPPVLQGLAVVECGAQSNTSGQGTNYTGGYIWEPTNGTAGLALVSYCNPNPRPRSVSAFYQFEAPNATTGARGYCIRKFRDEKRKGLYIECSFTRTWSVMAVDNSNLILGAYLGTNVIS